MDMQSVWQTVYDWATTTGLKLLVILVMIVIALRLAKIISKRLLQAFKFAKLDEEMQKRADTLSSIIRYVLSIAIVVTGLIMILGAFGIEIGPILATAGIAGVALGFGAQHIVKDIISGFFILMDDQIRVGDVVQICGKGGVVEKINLRITVLRDLAGNVHYIPNGSIEAVTNMTKEYSRYVFEIGVAYREDIDEVVEIIKKVDEELRADEEFKSDILQPIEVLGLDQFADSAIIIKARTTTKPIKQWRIGREFNKRLKKAFDEKNIEIPFPHLTLYMGEDKQGQSPPINISLRKDGN